MSGSQYERDLLNALERHGWAGMRAPASGGGRDADSPDVLVGVKHTYVNKTEFIGHTITSVPLAIELKATSSTTGYVTGEEVDALESFAERFGATPLLALRPKRSGGAGRSRFYLIRPRNSRLTDGGRYGLPCGDAHERASMVVFPATENKDSRVEYLERER